jgi:hypothetical protein
MTTASSVVRLRGQDMGGGGLPPTWDLLLPTSWWCAISSGKRVEALERGGFGNEVAAIEKRVSKEM